MDWPGAAQPQQCSGAGSGVLPGATDGGGRRLGMWQAEKMNRASILVVEEALLAIHVASNGSQESTDPNCSFKLQDTRGIKGLEGRFRVRT